MDPRLGLVLALMAAFGVGAGVGFGAFVAELRGWW
jgi:hypothetical protein